MISGVVLIYPDIVTDIIGFGLTGLIYAWHQWVRRPMSLKPS
jgi:UPF0716 family protein affecting phage T7 exclusion